MAASDVLSESEIDALMESVDDADAGEAAGDDGEYRRFSFGAREYGLLREFTALQALTERQLELFLAALQKQLSFACEGRVESTTLVSAADLLASLERTLAVTTVALTPLNSFVFVTMPADLLSLFVDRYFGGGGAVAPRAGDRSRLTPSELRIAERVAGVAIDALVEAWDDKIELEAGAPETQDFPERLAALPDDEVLVSLAFSLSFGEVTGSVRVLMPFTALEPFRERFAPARRAQGPAEGGDAVWGAYLRREVPNIELELAVVLDSGPVSLQELLQLNTGSIVPISSPELVTLVVDQTVLAEGRYGSFDGSKAVQIGRILTGLETSGQ